MTVEELPEITGSLQFRLMEEGGNIVALFNAGNTSKKNCFVIRRQAGESWVNALGFGKNTNNPIDVVHLEFGRDIPHNNLQPSKAVYTWFRVS